MTPLVATNLINTGATYYDVLLKFLGQVLRSLSPGVILLCACGEPPDSNFSRLTMYQSLEHDEVVVVEIKRAEPANELREVRVSLGEAHSQWTKEVLSTHVFTGGSNVSSDNLKAKWLSPDTLSLCLIGNGRTHQTITINVLEKSHSITQRDCPL